MKKICFVIMGFGKKADYRTGKTYDLDKTYKNIIKPSVEECDYNCVRSDEINHTGLIEKPMYSLLIHADLVIADISTLNPNAMYELGIRHASKPYSTIIISEEKNLNGFHPFDISHINTLPYRHLGEDIGYSETVRFKKVLKNMIKAKDKGLTDSPLYEFLGNINAHTLSDTDKEELVSLVSSEEKILMEKICEAKELMTGSSFVDAFRIWKNLNKNNPNEIYYIQQMALAKYKSQVPDRRTALEEAKTTISVLLNDHNDPETLGIAGAINKNLYLITNDLFALEKAFGYYEKGYKLNKNYYNGENYATCTELLYLFEKDMDLKTHYKVLSTMIRKEVLSISKDLLMELESQGEVDKWLYATLANLNFYFDNTTEFNSFEKLFKENTNEDRQIKTYENGINHIKRYKEEVE